LWTLAIGECPLKEAVNDGFWGLMAAVSKDDIASTFPTCFSDSFRDLIKCCLQLDPSARWTSERLLDHPFVKSALSVEETLPHWPSALNMLVIGDLEAEKREQINDRLPGDMKRSSVSIQRQLLNYSAANNKKLNGEEKSQKENILRYSNVDVNVNLEPRSKVRPSVINTSVPTEFVDEIRTTDIERKTTQDFSQPNNVSTSSKPNSKLSKSRPSEPRKSLLSNGSHSRHSSLMLDFDVSGWVPMSARPADIDFMPNLDELYDETPFDSPKQSPLTTPKRAPTLLFDDLSSLQISNTERT
jgi:serine/threonine protein kinase